MSSMPTRRRSSIGASFISKLVYRAVVAVHHQLKRPVTGGRHVAVPVIADQHIVLSEERPRRHTARRIEPGLVGVGLVDGGSQLLPAVRLTDEIAVAIPCVRTEGVDVATAVLRPVGNALAEARNHIAGADRHANATALTIGQ